MARHPAKTIHKWPALLGPLKAGLHQCFTPGLKFPGPVQRAPAKVRRFEPTQVPNDLSQGLGYSCNSLIPTLVSPPKVELRSIVVQITCVTVIFKLRRCVKQFKCCGMLRWSEITQGGCSSPGNIK